MSLFVEHERRKQWSSVEGWTTVRTWRGPGDEVDTFVSDVLPTGYSGLEITQELDGWNTVQATYAVGNYYGDPPSETGLISRTWTLETQAQTVPLIGHYKAVALDLLTTNASKERWVYMIQLSVALFRYQMERWKRGEDVTQPTFLHPYGDGSVMTGVHGSVTSAMTADYQFAKTLADELIKDDNASFVEFSYVLRKSEVVTTASAIAAAHAHVGQFLTYAGLTAHEGTLSTAPFIGSNNIPYNYWFKQPPQIQQVSQGQYQITQDYVSAATYNQYIYGTAVSS